MTSPDIAAAGGRQDTALLFDNLAIALDNKALTAAGLTVGTGVNTKFKAANTTTYLSSGIFKSKTTFEVAPTVTTHDIAANASSVQERVYVVLLDAAGTATIIAGAIASGSGNAKYPDIASTAGLRTQGLTPIGACRIAVAAGATSFTAGTDSPTTAGALTVTYTDGYPIPKILSSV